MLFFGWLVFRGKAGCPAGFFTSKIAPKALGLTVPDKLIVHADVVID